MALTANLLILLAVLAYFRRDLTLPGIAGVILTMGVGVDTNVLVFERIREELRHGKTVRAAVTNGFDRVLDHDHRHPRDRDHRRGSSCSQFGTGPIKGFAVTLVIGLIGERVRLVLRQQVPLRLGARQGPRRDAEHLGAAMEILKNPHFDFLGKAKYFIALSALFIGGGLAVMLTPGACATASSSRAARS